MHDRAAVQKISPNANARMFVSWRSASASIPAPGVATLAIEQRRPPSVAEPASDRTKLVVMRRHQGASGKQHAVIVVIGEPGVLRLGAQHPVAGELVVEAALHAAHEAARIAQQ